MTDIIVDHVTKKYRIRQVEHSRGANSLRRQIPRLFYNRRDFSAIRDVNFQVARGEALAIIGHNGAGKSTVLKLLARITAPSSGEIRINGRLSALIELGTGFHYELTGRENIYLNGSILGMRRAEIRNKLERIIQFSEIGRFIDIPVKRYSSGMYLRLGFSIAAYLDPEILLVDEVLAVGDIAFQAKCLQRIQELKKAGTTIIFVSHDLLTVERMCDRALLMQSGQITADGIPTEVISQYQRLACDLEPNGQKQEHLSRNVECISVSFHDSEGRPSSEFRTGDFVSARLGYFAHERLADLMFSICVYWPSGWVACQFTTALDSRRTEVEAGPGVIEFSCSEIGLQPGLYRVDVGVERGREVIDWKYNCCAVRIHPGRLALGDFYMPQEWRLIPGVRVFQTPPEGPALVRNHESSTEVSTKTSVRSRDLL
jgi:ABC-type polysaccharide/polyol phosphate transport system ATPase subunit